MQKNQKGLKLFLKMHFFKFHKKKGNSNPISKDSKRNVIKMNLEMGLGFVGSEFYLHTLIIFSGFFFSLLR